jgi:hypothetical protein
MTKQIIRSAGERLKMSPGISEQRLKVSPMMIKGNKTERDAPEPLDAISIRVIGRRVDQIQLMDAPFRGFTPLSTGLLTLHFDGGCMDKSSGWVRPESG